MKVLIFGLGVSGQAVKEYCQKRGDKVVVFDEKLAPEPIDLKGIDIVVKSPGICFSNPFIQKILKNKIPITSEIDLALDMLGGKTLYAISGSNGKTTTTLLTTHLLNISGKKALAVGNVGVPLISKVDADIDTFVIELSSFQLEAMHLKKVFNSACLLNITPNHLDRHQTFRKYAEIKLRLRQFVQAEGKFYISKQIADQFPIGGEIFDLNPLDSLLSSIDKQNVSAAAILSGVDNNLLKIGLQTFQKPPHRLEFVKQSCHVTFIDDSKATSVDATCKAIESIDSNVILIAGGVDKGGSFKQWGRFKNLRKVFAIGEARIRIYKELSPMIEVEKILTLEEGVKKAAQYAKKGETVLLSPGCSSYDQFENYIQRGQRFKEIVQALEEMPS